MMSHTIARKTASRTAFAAALMGLMMMAGVAEAAPRPPVRYMEANSSNFSRRSSRTIRRVVIHTIEGSEAGAISWFRNSRANVSAHYVVAKSGRITQMVQEKDVAWHVRNYNSDSIGIENEGYAGRNGWTEAQYQALGKLVAYLCDKYRIPKKRSHIQSHAELDPSRRTDPGPHFNWNYFLGIVNGQSGGSTTTPAPTQPTTPAPTTPSTGSGFAIEVTASALNVRSRVWGTVIGSTRRGQRFVVRSSSQGWYQIDFGGRTAWVSGKYVSRVAANTILVKTSWLNTRTGPSTGYQRIGAVGSNQRYVVVGWQGSWLKIQFDHRTSWVHSGYVTGQRLS